MARVVVLGGGESGVGSAVLAKIKGLDTFLSDAASIAPKYLDILREWKIDFEQGGHTKELILNADTVVKSPGIPDKVAIIKELHAAGIPVISEIEFAAPYCDAKTICITGSNGKTTTTTLIYQIMRDAGINVGLAGNIGESFALSVATQKHDWYVIELSSFQLDGMFKFRADIAILLNITPDHLDRYDYVLQNYIDSKIRIIRNQSSDQSFIYCADDPLIVENLDKHELSMKVMPFSVKSPHGAAAWIEHEQMKVSLLNRNLEYDINKLQIKGIHNRYNAMAATLATLEAGVKFSDIEQTLSKFTGVEHRLEPCGTVDGVEYINDSKATNVDSVWYALESMGEEREVVWIAGGTDKGNDYSQLFELAEQKVKTLICMGVDNKKLTEAFSGKIPVIIDTHTPEEAFAQAAKAAASLFKSGEEAVNEGSHAAGNGAGTQKEEPQRAGVKPQKTTIDKATAKTVTVLLSPACASFDLFKNYEHRGELFKAWVSNKKAHSEA